MTLAVGKIEHLGPAAPMILRRDPTIPDYIRNWTPRTGLGTAIRSALPFLPREIALELIDKISSAGVLESSLSLVVIRGDGKIEDVGEVSRRVVTDAGVGFIVDAFQNLTELEVMKYHGIGSGTTAEAAAQTALVTEFTTQLNPDNTRATGTTIEGATANIYRTVATNTVDSSVTVNEHAIFNQAAVAGGTMLDRSMFSGSPVGLTSGDSLQSTYDLTFSSGG